jgi:hypothetical protein
VTQIKETSSRKVSTRPTLWDSGWLSSGAFVGGGIGCALLTACQPPTNPTPLWFNSTFLPHASLSCCKLMPRNGVNQKFLHFPRNEPGGNVETLELVFMCGDWLRHPYEATVLYETLLSLYFMFLEMLFPPKTNNKNE